MVFQRNTLSMFANFYFHLVDSSIGYYINEKTMALPTIVLYPLGESNPHLKFRKLPFYPLN